MFFPNYGALSNIEKRDPMKDAASLVADQDMSFGDAILIFRKISNYVEIIEESNNITNESHVKNHCLLLLRI